MLLRVVQCDHVEVLAHEERTNVLLNRRLEARQKNRLGWRAKLSSAKFYARQNECR